MDWTTVKCTICQSKKYCRKHNITKGSKICQINLKIIPKPVKDNTFIQNFNVLLYYLASNSKTKDNDDINEL